MKDETEGKKGSAVGKVKKLQKQYNKILVDLFDQFAAESIEQALEQNEGSFGENINTIVQTAADTLKSRVLEELGISGGEGAIVAVGGFDIGGALGAVTGADDEEDDDDVEEVEDADEEVAEEGKLPPGLAAYMKKKKGGKDDKDDDDTEDADEEVAEEGKLPPGLAAYMKKKKGGKDDKKCTCDGPCKCKDNDKESMNESINRDKFLSKSRRSDQSMLTEAYTAMYKKD